VMNNDSPTMSATKVSAFLKNIENFGAVKTNILNSVCIDPHFLNAPDNRLTAEEVNRIFLAAAELTRNKNIGLNQGERLSKGFSNILGHILMNCRDLGVAAEKYVQYERIVDETSVSKIQTIDDTVVFSMTNVAKDLQGNRILSDFKMSGMLSYTRMLSGERITLKEAYFDHSKPQDLSEYQRIFNCPVFFGKPINALLFNKKLLRLPIIEPNKDLLPLFESIAGGTLERMEKSETYAGKVLKIIIKKMNGEIPPVDSVARQLSISIRSLQGYLKKEGTSYIKLVNEVRKNSAIHYLREKNTSIAEIAYVLGFSETSAFNRAFKKWTRLTPGEFRTKDMEDANFFSSYQGAGKNN
jgi:AraC-like DNA-binding protein